MVPCWAQIGLMALAVCIRPTWLPLERELDVGIMVVRLSTDPSVVGEYTVTFRMNGGNAKQLHITAE